MLVKKTLRTFSEGTALEATFSAAAPSPPHGGARPRTRLGCVGLSDGGGSRTVQTRFVLFQSSHSPSLKEPPPLPGKAGRS